MTIKEIDNLYMYRYVVDIRKVETKYLPNDCQKMHLYYSLYIVPMSSRDSTGLF